MVHLRASWHLTLSVGPTPGHPTRLRQPETVSFGVTGWQNISHARIGLCVRPNCATLLKEGVRQGSRINPVYSYDRYVSGSETFSFARPKQGSEAVASPKSAQA